MNPTPDTAAPAPAPAPVTPSPEAMEFSLEDLMGVSEAERAVIQADQAAEVTSAAPEVVAPVAPVPVAAPAPVVVAEAAPVPVPAAVPAAVTAPNVAELQATITANKKAIADLATKYEDGEISSTDWQAQNAALQDKTVDALAEIKMAQRDMAVLNQGWDKHVAGFMAEKQITSPAHISAFDAVLKEVEAAYPGMSDADLANTAYGRLYVMMQGAGMPLPAIAAVVPAPVVQVQALNPATKLAPLTPPPTLAHLPAHSSNGQIDGKYSAVQAAIDSGDVYAAERAMASLSPEAQDEFLKSQ